MAAAKRPPKRKRPSPKIPSANRIEAGYYIDFEGFGSNEYSSSPPPVLIGLYNQVLNPQFRQVVFTEQYRWAAENPGVDHEVVFHPDRKTFLKNLADSASGSKPLFAYSEHELRVIENSVGHKITRRYRDVRSIAKQWLKKDDQRSAQKLDRSLSSVAELMGVKLQKKLERGGVTSRLRTVRTYSCSRARWATAPEGVKEQWREVLRHNRSDVMAIFEMMSQMCALSTRNPKDQ